MTHEPGRDRPTTLPRHQWALREVEAALRRAGWTTPAEGDSPRGDHGADLVIERGGQRYVVELKVAPEGRGDRLLPLWSQACLQASRWARDERPLAVVAAPRIAPQVAESLLEFAAEYAPDAGAGILDFHGLRRFRGEGLDGLDADPPPDASARIASSAPAADLFSDLNQWLLKVLLAPEMPEELLSAPRERYRNASQLASAARVSAVTGYRFVGTLKDEGYLDTSGRTLRLVRRKSLFTRWRAASARRVKEAPMRLLAGGNADRAAARLAESPDVCLALFAAADALQVGFVSGVPPYVYVRGLGARDLARSQNLAPAERHERPDLFVREARAAESVFRGMVERDGIHVCDVLQVWLDVASHPSRGREQADLIRARVLEPLMNGKGGP